MKRNLKYLFTTTLSFLKSMKSQFFIRNPYKPRSKPCISCILKFFYPPLFNVIWKFFKSFYIYVFKSKILHDVPLKDLTSWFEHLDIKGYDEMLKKSGPPGFEHSLEYSERYNWKKLIEDIKKNGIYPPIMVQQKVPGGSYTTKNGNHRLRVLKYLYGPEHKISIIHYGKYWYKQGSIEDLKQPGTESECCKDAEKHKV